MLPRASDDEDDYEMNEIVCRNHYLTMNNPCLNVQEVLAGRVDITYYAMARKAEEYRRRDQPYWNKAEFEDEFPVPKVDMGYSK